MNKKVVTIALSQLMLMLASADCTTNAPAICHPADTNGTGDVVYPQRRTSNGYDIQCLTTTNAGSFSCVSVTNNCIFQTWVWSPIFGDGTKFSVTNQWNTTTAANPGCQNGGG